MTGLDSALSVARDARNSGAWQNAGGVVHTDDDGYKWTTPPAVELAIQAGIATDELTLARVIAAEAGSLPTTYGYAIAECAIREATMRGKSVTSLVTGSGRHQGHYGQQRGGRWCASSKAPQIWHVLCAKAALVDAPTHGGHIDLTRGARRWFSPKVQDGGKQGGISLSYDALGIVEKWGREGWEWVGPIFDPGDPNRVELIDPWIQFHLRRSSNPDIEAGRRAIEKGRQFGSSLGVSDNEGARDEADGGNGLVIVGVVAAKTLI